MEMVSSVPVAQQAMMVFNDYEPLLSKLCVLLCTPRNAPECISEHLKSSKFPGGACPSTPLEWITAGRSCSLLQLMTLPPQMEKLCTDLVALILSPISYKNRRWVARKVVCKLNNYILGRKSSVRQRRRAPVAKRVHRLTLLNCSLTTCFAAGVHSKLQLLEVGFNFFFFFLNKPLYQLIYSYHFSSKSSIC